jgi:hypothetical protein
MKIDGTKSSSDVSKSKKTDKAKSGDGKFQSMVAGETGKSSASQGTSTSSQIASVDALLMAQSTEDPAQQKARKRMRDRAETLLDKLNDLKMAILLGNVTVGHMVSIADIAATHREKITDPELSALLDEVDLRAQIELAKLEIAREKLA